MSCTITLLDNAVLNKYEWIHKQRHTHTDNTHMNNNNSIVPSHLLSSRATAFRDRTTCLASVLTFVGRDSHIQKPQQDIHKTYRFSQGHK